MKHIASALVELLREGGGAALPYIITGGKIMKFIQTDLISFTAATNSLSF